MPVEPGLVARLEHVVGEADTAAALGSGDVAVLGTPQVLAWVEAACVAAITGHLDDGETTVGMRTQLDHVHPSAVGATVASCAELERVEGRRLTFAVTATEGDTQIAHGRLTRVIVDRARFMERSTG